MNKVYKIIWSKIRNCYVVVSEIARNHARGGSVRDCRRRGNTVLAAMLLSAVLSTGICMPVWAEGENNTGTKYYGVNPTESVITTTITTNENGEGAIGAHSLAAGENASAQTTNSIAIGLGSKVYGEMNQNNEYWEDSIAIGHNASAYGGRVLAIGPKAKAGTEGQSIENAIAIGYSAFAQNSSSIAIGERAAANGLQSIAFGGTGQGVVSGALTNYSTALGFGALAGNTNDSSAIYATAVGHSAKATGKESSAFGYLANAGASQATALGKGSNAYTNESTAVGGGAIAGDKDNTDANHATAVGHSAQATGQDSSAFGYQAAAKAKQATALGKGSNAKTTGSTAVGLGAVAGNTDDSSAIYATAVGHSAQATGKESSAFGRDAKAEAARSIALGYNANAHEENGIALGFSASVTINGGVALGSDSIASTAAKVSGYDPFTNAVSTDTSATWRSTAAAVSVGSSKITRQITNVAAGAQDTDAVNVAQLKRAQVEVTQGTNIGVIANTASGHTVYTVNAPEYTVTKGTTTTADGVTSTPYTISGEVVIDDGNGGTTTKAITVGTITDTDTNTTYTIGAQAGAGTAGDIVNTYTITDSDGKALEQTIVDTNTVLEESANGLTLSGNSIKLSVKDTSGNEVSGTVSLSDIQTAVDTTYTLSGTSKTEGNNTTYTVDLTDSKGKPAGTMTIVDTNTTYTIGAEAGEGSTINTYTVTDSDGKALEQTIVDTNTTYTMTTTAGTGKVVNKYTITGSDGKNLGEIEDTDTDTQYELFGEKKKNENGATYKISLKDREGNDAGSMIIADTRNTVTAGDNIQVKTEDNEDGSINYIISASASSNVKVIDGENTTVTEGQDGDFTTYAVNVATNGTVASGDTGIVTGDTVYNETRVQNDGNFIKADNSAAENLTVLDEQVSANTTNIENLGNQINNTNNQINRLDSRMRKGLAGAAALAALHPMDFNPDDKMQFAAGVGNYRGETAAAVGAFYRPDESVMFSIGGTFGNNDNMVNAGITFGLDGTRNRITRSRTAMAHEIVELRDHIAKQDQQIAQLTNLVNKLVGPEQRLENPSMFPDVPANHWAYQYIEDLQKRGIIEGYPDGNFSGNRSMTRYEFAAMLDRALQKGVKLDADIAKEFEAELGRIYVERIAGQDNDRKKIERVRVNNDDAKTRDFYGSKILTVAAEKAAGK